jgi:hypothetical protein
MTIEGQVLSQFEIVPPEHLFHYTSMEGMEAILSSCRIWASDIHSMNDASELHYPLEIIRERLILAHDRYPDSRMLETLIDSVGTLSSAPLYISCFSAKGDLLSQWREYCPQEGGVSLGFDPGSLTGTDDPAAFELSQCVYDQARQRELTDQAIESFLRESSASPNLTEEEKIVAFQSLALRFSPLLKHSAFEDEREWRITSQFPMPEGLGFGIHGPPDNPIRHYEYLLTKSDVPPQLEWVIIGPSSNQATNRGKIELLLSKLGLDPLVTESVVPLRLPNPNKAISADAKSSS